MLPTLYHSLLPATVLCTGYTATATPTNIAHVATLRRGTLVTYPAKGENAYRDLGLFY